MISVIVFVLCLLESTYSHICLENPAQDGGFPTNALIATEPQCSRTTPACGLAKKRNVDSEELIEEMSIVSRAPPRSGGTSGPVSIILNTLHYNSTNPGLIELSYCSSECTIESNFVVLNGCSAPDRQIAVPARITSSLTLPNIDGTITLRAKYITNGATNYYICSTLNVTSTNSNSTAGCVGGFNFATVNMTTASTSRTTASTVSGTSSNDTNGDNIQGSSSGKKLLGYSVVYVGVAAGVIALIIIAVVVVIVVIVIKRRRNNFSDYDYPLQNNNDERPKGPIPTLSMAEIQSTRMAVAQGVDG